MSCFNGFLNCLMPDRRDKKAAQIEISTPCNLITAAPPRMSTPPARYAKQNSMIRKDSIASPISPPPVYTPYSNARMLGDKPVYYACAYSQPPTPGSNSSRRSLMQKRESCITPPENSPLRNEVSSIASAPIADMNLDTTPRAAKAIDMICSPFRHKKTNTVERVEFEPAVRKSDEEERVAKVPRKSQRFTRRFTVRSSANTTTSQRGKVAPFAVANKNGSTASFRRQQQRQHRREVSIDQIFQEKNNQFQSQQQQQQQEPELQRYQIQPEPQQMIMHKQQQQNQYQQQQQQRESLRREPSNRIKNGGNGVGHTPIRNGSLRLQQTPVEVPRIEAVAQANRGSILMVPTADQIAEMERFIGEEERQMRLRSSPETETDDEIDDGDQITYADLHYPHHQSVRSFEKYY